MTFIDKENLLVTEKNGKLLKINIKNGIKKEISHEIQSIKFKNVKRSQASKVAYLMFFIMMDGFILVTVTFSKENVDASNSSRFSSTAIARGRLKDNKILNLEVLFIAKPKLCWKAFWLKNGY